MKKRKAGWIYVLQENGNSTGPIKIGFANDVDTRIEQLQAGNPRRLRLLARIHGDSVMEAALHRQYRAYRLVGEWFEWSNEIETFVHSCNYYGARNAGEPRELTLDEEVTQWTNPLVLSCRQELHNVGRKRKERLRPPPHVADEIARRAARAKEQG